MKTSLIALENQFDSLLDAYCMSVEHGELEVAEAASEQAETLLEEIGIRKVSQLLNTEIYPGTPVLRTVTIPTTWAEAV